MNSENQSKFITGLQVALQKERTAHRTYLALAKKESNEARRKALIGLSETEAGHSERWVTRLKELGAEVPPDREITEGTNLALGADTKRNRQRG